MRSAVTSEALDAVKHFLSGVHDDAILCFQKGGGDLIVERIWRRG